MKKTILLFVIMLMATFTINSCSSDRDSDDQKTVTPKYNVLGKWNAVQYQDTDGTWKDMSILNWYSEFKADGSYKSYSDNQTYTGTYTYDNKDHVTATVGGEKIHYNIKSMSGTDAVAEMYYQSNPGDKTTFRLKK